MPKYAVDFLAEIQELTSATNFDDCSDSVDLLTSLHLLDVPIQRRPSEDNNNVVTALMGNAQCCFKRYPGYQAHRHVVVSRGVQCNEAIIKKIIDNEFQSAADNHNLFHPQTTERGDVFIDNYQKDNSKSPEQQSIAPLKISVNPCRNGGLFKRKPDVFTPITQEPPELRESSKFYHKSFLVDYKKNRKYFDEEIDSLSATISNYSLHEKLLRLETNGRVDRPNEPMDQNNHQLTNLNITPTFHTRDCEFKSSTEAIKGSLTGSQTVKTHNLTPLKKDLPENPSSDSFTSFGNVKDNKSTFITNSGDLTQETNIEELERRKRSSQTNICNSVNDKLANQPVHLMHSLSQQCTKLKCSSTSPDKNINGELSGQVCLSDKANRSNTASVTFMKGSEELRKYEEKLSESDNLNALRKKQRFIMKHSRSNSKANLTGNALIPPPLGSDCCPADKNENHSIHYQMTPELPPAALDLPVLKSPSRTAHQTSIDVIRNLSRNSTQSENACNTPNPVNPHKIKRTVSFDRSKPIDRPVHDLVANGGDGSNQPCNRSTVRAKYCTKKVIKHKFYVPESANIEQILRDPSDRRIKAICDRHNCDIEIYSKVPKCGFLKNIIILAAPNNENLHKCVRSLDYSMHWCLTAQLTC